MIKRAYFAGGCFWCTESIFQRIKGVTEVIPGYMGGQIKNPSYNEVCKGNTGHVETVKVLYDMDLVSYDKLLEIFFLIHDPTTVNRQGNDIGSHYRSAIFFTDLNEKYLIKNYISQLDKKEVFSKPIVTEVNKEVSFYSAEIEHHDYYNQNAEQPYCQFVISPKIKKLKSIFSQYTK